VSSEGLVVLGLLLFRGEAMFLEFTPGTYLMIGSILEEVTEITLARAEIVDMGRLLFNFG
jgi:hypothetical protein